MQYKVIKQLSDLNHNFYDRFAESFADSRGGNEPGMERALAGITPGSRVLELGCAQGRFVRRLPPGCDYVGLDFSAPLIARAAAEPLPGPARFIVADLMAEDWPAQLDPPYDVILARAVLHHIPGYGHRLRVLRQAAALLAPTGQIIMANWQFLNVERFRVRLQPWESLGLSEADVEPGDCLLDWRREGWGLRYVHHLGAEETELLVLDAGLKIVDSYTADGREGNLTLYTVMTRQLQ